MFDIKELVRSSYSLFWPTVWSHIHLSMLLSLFVCPSVQGNSMACQGQYVTAIEFFTKAIQLDSSDYRWVMSRAAEHLVSCQRSSPLMSTQLWITLCIYCDVCALCYCCMTLCVSELGVCWPASELSLLLSEKHVCRSLCKAAKVNSRKIFWLVWKP